VIKIFFRLLLPSLLFTTLSSADTAVVKRSVTLRPDPSTDNRAIKTLAIGERVTLVSLRKNEGYLHVTVGKQTGWVWARNVDVEESTSDETEGRGTTAKRSTEATDTCTAGSTNGPSNHVGPTDLYPDPMKTTGCAATLEKNDLTRRWTENCPGGKDSCTYSQSHRKVLKGERTLIYDEYNVPSAKRNIDNGEIDHFYPLCAGGSNSASNLWYQPIDNEWNGRNFGFKEKDKLEAWICKEIKSGHLEPQDAFDRLTKDWVKFYIEEFADDDELKEQLSDDDQQGGR
jgi:uncharacterized protein YgiM (DUF1202 family)